MVVVSLEMLFRSLEGCLEREWNWMDNDLNQWKSYNNGLWIIGMCGSNSLPLVLVSWSLLSNKGGWGVSKCSWNLQT